MSTQQSGLVSGNKQNIAGGATPRNRSRFPLTYSKFQTERFAEYVPFFVMEGVKNDVLPLHSNHEVQTYTLKSPILQSLAKKKDYFNVPMQAILPNNWEKFYTEPNIGQDVPDDCGLGVANFWNKIRTLFLASFTALDTTLSGTGSVDSKLDALLHFLLFFEPIYSTGSLMEMLGISGHNWFKLLDQRTSGQTKFISFDEFFDYHVGFISTFLVAAPGNSVSFTIGSDTYVIRDDADRVIPGTTQSVSLRQALELMRDDLSFTVTAVSGTGLIPAGYDLSTEFATTYMPTSDAPLNLGRLWAYQLVCAHFYSNDHVDFIYSAELFRQYVLQLATRSLSSGVLAGDMGVRFFSVNGLQYQYDALCAKIFDGVLGGFGSSGIFSYSASAYTSDSLNEALAYFVALFSFKRSLRFMDYFTGSRAYPLAGNQNPSAPVSGGAVDVLEMSKASMMTKFLQAVNRSGRKFSNYMKELFGGKDLAYDYHSPMYLAHTSDLVGAAETENTGAAQVTNQIAVTSRLRATSNRQAFTFSPDRDCIVIGISYYDLPRVYLSATERQNFNIDRFDMFNPFMQYIGDQAVYEAEIGTENPQIGQAFSYTNKDMHYKQRYNQAAGGFCIPSTGLDNWIFPADLLARKYFHNISPSFIRSFNSELDRFYQRLTGYSLGTYFHFIVRYDNRMDATREMTYAPTINV